MDKALVFGTKDCRFESCQGHMVPHAFTLGTWRFGSLVSGGVLRRANFSDSLSKKPAPTGG